MIVYNLSRYGLTVMNTYLAISSIAKIWNSVATYLRIGTLDKEIRLFNFDIWRHLWNLTHFMVTFCAFDIALPICVFMALLGKSLLDFTDKDIQYFSAAAVIVASRRFMSSIARFPAVGGKVYMLTKVFFCL